MITLVRVALNDEARDVEFVRVAVPQVHAVTIPRPATVAGPIILGRAGGGSGTLPTLPERDDYPAGTIPQRLDALVDRKAEEVSTDLALWFENQLL